MNWQIHFGLVGSTNVTILDNIYGTWSLIHFILRVYLICLAESNVHEWAHKVALFLHRCPSHAISLDVSPLVVRMLATVTNANAMHR